MIQLLDSPSLDARLGACQALERLGSRAAPAVPKLREILKADELWLRVQASAALNAFGEPAWAAVPDLLEIVAKGPTADDPHGREQRFISQALFSRRGGLLRGPLEGGWIVNSCSRRCVPACAMTPATGSVLPAVQSHEAASSERNSQARNERRQ